MQAHNSEDRSGAYAQAGGALLQNFLSLFPAGSEAGRVWQLLIAGHGADPSCLAALQTGYFQQQMALWGRCLGASPDRLPAPFSALARARTKPVAISASPRTLGATAAITIFCVRPISSIPVFSPIWRKRSSWTHRPSSGCAFTRAR